jgi:hypothetical protein
MVSIAAAVGLTACGDDSQRKVAPQDGARVVIQEVHRERADGMTYIEGAIQYVELSGHGQRALKVQLGRAPVARTIEPGEYRVVSYTRSCPGACQAPLDEPTDRCESNLSVARGERVALRVVTVVARRCTIRIAR